MPYATLPGTRAPVKAWTAPDSIEPQASRQLHHIGDLPWVEGMAVLPDVHYGKGATVGSVIAIRQALGICVPPFAAGCCWAPPPPGSWC